MQNTIQNKNTLEEDQHFMLSFLQAIEEGLPEPEPEEILEQLRFEEERKKIEQKKRLKKQLLQPAQLF